MGTEVRVEHAYPAAMDFLRRHGPETLAVLHDLLAHAEIRGGGLVVRASVRDIAGRLGFISKDTVHRRLRQLVRAGVLRRTASAGRPGSMSSMFEIDLAGTAISVEAFGAARTSGGPRPTPAPTSTPPLPTPTSPSSSSSSHPTRSTPTPPPTLPPLPPPVSTTDRRVHSCASRAGVEDPALVMRDGHR
ncbi:MAG TPA: winged helix-turn-helix domain-containing protein [Acidimicrobiales bacterium]|nr:winged helix-turn-helix domain-containing protein [Acidimicrobiales bacterium]